MKKFTTIINESIDIIDLKNEIRTKIEKTIENSGVDYTEFLKNYMSESDDSNSKTKIDGLISDSDLYEFYMENGVIQQQIDSFLNSIGYFKNTVDVIGLYDYVVKGVYECILRTVETLLDEKTNTKEQ